jgi:lactoylglutathione lyase
MKIGKIYETHLQVADLQRSIQFYSKLGLELAHTSDKRKFAFFWVGNEKEQTLGLWEVATGSQVEKRHFAFEVSLEDLLKSKEWLREKGIELRAAFGKEPTEPIVHTWVPAASVYFVDPDDNSLEFITVLPDDPQISEEVVYLSEWNLMKKSAI